MKISLILIGSVSATALAGIAVAQATHAVWPQIDIADLEQCRPVLAQVHKLEQSYIRDVTARECNAPARFYSTESCRTARRWLSKTESQDDVVWFFEGNDRCQGTDYPCFGVKIYNTVRSGDEARRWAKYFLDKSSKAYSVTRGMDLWTAAREADTCVSGVWSAKFRTANASASPTAPVPVQVADVAPERAAAPAGPPPPLEAKAPLTADAEALAGAATAAIAATATATEIAPAPAAAAPTAASTTPPVTAAPPPAAPVIAAAAPTVLKPETASATSDPMAPVLALIAAGKTTEAIALGDQLAASQPKGEGNLTACRTRVLARQDLDRALVACYSTGKSGDPVVLETRGQLHLLAGRHQDAWNDFNTALTASKANSALYLRGLASAGMGKTADALKDMAKAEAGEEGIMAAYEAKGYTLASVMSGKPLVEEPARPVAAPVAAAAAAPVAAATPAADEPVIPLPNSVRAPADVPAATAAPETPVVPLPNAVYPPATEAAPAVPAEPAVPVPTAPTVAIPVAAEPAAAGSFAATTGSAVTVPGLSLPAVTDCLVPVAPGNGGRGAFKNKCNYPVRFTYCNIKPAEGVDQLTCGSDTKFRSETIGGNGSLPAVLGQSVAYFACRSPTLPEVIYTSNNGLEGYCR